jgi:hypothetical protein
LPKKARAFEPNEVARGSETLGVSVQQRCRILPRHSHLLRLDFVCDVTMFVGPPGQVSSSRIMPRPPRQYSQVNRPREQRDFCMSTIVTREGQKELTGLIDKAMNQRQHPSTSAFGLLQIKCRFKKMMIPHEPGVPFSILGAHCQIRLKCVGDIV